ncbi:hypothetical protein [Streptomyces sp. NPDC005538]|uniref:hypothetical protein n=1 Tax=unclassified Streptomyces TaxID=2593676 RepID=UPI0033B1F9B3
MTGTLLAFLSGCSDQKEKREYAVPNSLCGIPVDSSTLAPFMPPGRKLTVKQDTTNSLASICEIRVDSRQAVQTEQMWLSDAPNTAYFVGGAASSKLDHQAENGRFLYSGWEAFGKTHGCTSKKLLGSELFTAFQMHSSNHQDAAAMKKLITAYTKAVEKTSTCKDGKPFA